MCEELKQEIQQILFNNSTASGDCRNKVAWMIVELVNTRAPAWQDISTAPDNLTVGDSALVFAHGYQTVALYLNGGWMSRGEKIFPTDWMPLSEPPQSGEGE